MSSCCSVSAFRVLQFRHSSVARGFYVVPALSPVVADFQLGLMLLVGRRTVGCRRIADVLVSTWGCAAAGAVFRGSACWRVGRIELRCVSESSHDDESGRSAGQIVGVSARRATLRSHCGEVERLAGFN